MRALTSKHWWHPVLTQLNHLYISTCMDAPGPKTRILKFRKSTRPSGPRASKTQFLSQTSGLSANEMKKTEKEKTFKQEEAWTWEEDNHKVFRSIARTGPGCHDGCGVLLYVKDGKLEKVEGDPDFPFNQGRLCPRCLALPQVVYHPDRLKYPLKRAGRRGEGKWERITWEEAYEAIVQSFNEIKKKHGPESVIFCHGTARDIGTYVSKLAYSFGSPNRVCFRTFTRACLFCTQKDDSSGYHGRDGSSRLRPIFCRPL